MRTLGLALVMAAFAGSSYAAEEAPQPTSTYFEGAKITVNARAKADGFMRVRVVPENGEPREATFGIARRMNENDLAKNIAVSLNTVLAPEYVADKDNGEHVKIQKKQKNAPNFSVEVTFNAPGFSVILDQ
jgi:hypothetical protein